METVQTWIHYQTTINDLKAQNAKLVAALKAVSEHTLGDGTLCWCMCYEDDDEHESRCATARAVLKELGE